MVTAAGRVLTVLLESGQKLRAPNIHSNNVGDAVCVGFSFIGQEAQLIPLQNENLVGPQHAPKIESDEGKYYDEDHLNIFDSGALRLWGEVLEDSVVLEFSDGMLISGRMLRPNELT